jgi:hypothetical protein
MQRVRVRVKQISDRSFEIFFNRQTMVLTQALKRPGKNGRLAKTCALYLGADSYDAAVSIANEIRGRYPQARISIRQSKRLKTAFEVKINHPAVELILQGWLYRSETTGQRVERHLKVVASRPSLQPDLPSRRHSAPVAPRHTGRTLVTGRAGITVGID